MLFDVAALAVHFPEGDFTSSPGIPGKDQSSFRAEVDAIRLVLEGTVKLLTLQSIVCDCMAAIDISQGGLGQCPELATRLHQAVRCLLVSNVCLDFVWVPSHGKDSPKFKGHPGAAKFQLRAWNANTDYAARHAMQQCLNGSLRERWHLQAIAEKWETAITTLASIAQLYAEHDSLR
eukprot:s3096_g4.t1